MRKELTSGLLSLHDLSSLGVVTGCFMFGVQGEMNLCCLLESITSSYNMSQIKVARLRQIGCMAEHSPPRPYTHTHTPFHEPVYNGHPKPP